MDRGERIGLAIVAAIWTVNGIIAATKAWSSGKIKKTVTRIKNLLKRTCNDTN